MSAITISSVRSTVHRPHRRHPATAFVTMLCICVVAWFCGGSSARAGTNLLPEGSDFEAGWNGFDVFPILLLPNWKTYQPPVIDSTTAAHGKCSLKLTNGSGGDVFRIFSRAVRITDPKGSITISFYAKADAPGCRIEFIVNNGGKRMISREATLSNQWTRYHFTTTPDRWFFPDSEGVKDVFYIQIRVSSAAAWKTAWFDAIQLENSELSDYQNPTDVDLSFTTDRHIKFYHPDQTPGIVLHGAGANVTGQPVHVQVEELFSGKKDPVMELRLTPGIDADHGAVTVPLKPRPRGLYRLTAKLADGRGFQQVAYGVIEPMGDRPHAQRAFFGGSTGLFASASLLSYVGLPVTEEDSICTWGNCSPEEFFAAARDMGWGWWHTYWECAFQTIQPDGPDKFRWRDSDTLVNLARKYDLDVYTNLATHGGPAQQPEWALGSTRLKTDRFKGQQVVDVKKFSAFARAMAEHFKGRITMWEPYNEPGVKMALEPEVYIEIQKEVYRNLKEVDPSCRVFGLCGTWDAGGDLYGWVKECLKLGAGSTMDGIAIHGYHTTDRNYVARVREIAKDITGKTYPIIDSEAGGANGGVYTHLIAAHNEHQGPPQPPQALVQHLANELVCGAERQSWFNMISSISINSSSYDILEYDGAPSMRLIACNTFIDRVGPSRGGRQVSIGGNIICYVFDLGDQSIALLWSAGDPKQLIAPLASNGGDRVTVENMAGQVMQPASDPQGIKLDIDDKVIYLRAAGLNADELAERLGKSRVPGLSEVAISDVRITRTPEDQPALTVTVEGNVPQSHAGAIEVVDTPKGWRLNPGRVAFSPLVLGQKITLLFPMSAGLETGAVGPLKLGVDNSKGMAVKTFDMKVWPAGKANGTVKIDGDLSQWDASSFRPLSDWASAAIRWDDAGLYVAAKVDDTTPRSYQETPGKADWQSDSVELYFNPQIEASLQNPAFGPGDFQLICSVRGGGDSRDTAHVAWRGDRPGDKLYGNKFAKPDSIQITSQRDARGYRLVIFIPWSNFPPEWKTAPGNFMGFSMAIRDVDKEHADLRRVIWAGGNDNYQRTDGYGVLILK